MYREKDWTAPQVTNLQSHFVLRRKVDELWVGPERVARLGEPFRVTIEGSRAVVLRAGTAAIGVRVVWAQSLDGRPGEVVLVDDGNPHGCLRLTVEHGRPHPGAVATPVGAAMWVRVGSGLAREAAFAEWRGKFEAAAVPTVDASSQGVRVEVAGEEGPVSVAAKAPWGAGGARLVPAPSRAVLEIDGVEVGRPILAAAEPLRSRGAGALEPVAVGPEKPTTWEAESGLVMPGMQVLEDSNASAGRYVAEPRETSGRIPGSVSWALRVEKPGRYWLWARTRAPDAQTDSFQVQVIGPGGETVEGAWHLVRSERWQWQALKLERAEVATPLVLDAGACRLQIRTREAGTAIDQLFVAPSAQAGPEGARLDEARPRP